MYNGLTFDSVLLGGKVEVDKVGCGSIIWLCGDGRQGGAPGIALDLFEVERGGDVVGASLAVLSWMKG